MGRYLEGVNESQSVNQRETLLERGRSEDGRVRLSHERSCFIHNKYKVSIV